jgi:prevent-host-death family protein
MGDIPLADAKAHLSDLVERAARGESVQITRRGRPVAQITRIDREPVPIDLAALRVLTDGMPLQAEPARSWLRSVRDGSRY